MKSKSSKNPPSDDGTLIQQVVKRSLIVLSLGIIILSSVALWTVNELTDFYQVKVQNISEQKHLLHVMRIAALERILTMHSMVIESDHFENDDKRMAFYSDASTFTHARIKFMKTPLTDYELGLMKRQGEITNIYNIKQENIVDMVIKGESKLALKSLKELGANKIIPILRELNTSIDNRNKDVMVKAKSFGQTNTIILISIDLLLLLGVIYIIRQTTYRAFIIISQLNETRNMLQKTIHELIQQKDTLDNHAIVSITDKKGNISYVNDKFCELSGYSRDELIGKNHRLLKSDVHSDEFYHDLWTTISHGNVWHGKICNKTKNNANYWVESTISPFLDDKGVPYQYVSIRTDITHLLEAKLKAEEASRSKSMFLSSMSHELRTPMNAILGFSQLINIKTKEEDTKQYNQEVLNAGEHLLKLINDVLDLSKIESGKLELNISSYSLKDILESCLLMINSNADKISIRIENKINTEEEIMIYVDELRFKQIVLNMLSNAVKYNKENGSITIECFLDENGMLRLSISDTGKGIPLDAQSNIFNPFDRGGQENSNILGTGLGLGISKELIEKMNGTIGFESVDGEGSCFWVNIPVVDTENPREEI